MVRLLDVGKIREDFPILRSRRLIYLDNAATTQKPRQVIEAVSSYYANYNANVHRGAYELSQEASRLYEEARGVVAKFINAGSWEEVIFVRNATEGINILALAFGTKLLRPGDEVVVSIMEHHSNLLPWIRLSESTGVRIKVVGLTAEGTLDYDELARLVTHRTRVVSIAHTSNVLGTINEVGRVAKIARDVGAYVVVDGAQSVPHMPVDVRGLGIDFLVFSGHKMMGPTGIGVLWGRRDLLEELPPMLVGGGTVRSVSIGVRGRELVDHRVVYEDLPWRLEAGTPNVAGAIGLAEAVRYLGKFGMESVRAHEVELTAYTIRRVEESLGDDVRVLGPRDVRVRGGIVSMEFRRLNPHVVASLLSLRSIAVRSGYHCAQPLHEFLGAKEGSLRASFYIYNGLDDVDAFIEALREVLVTLK